MIETEPERGERRPVVSSPKPTASNRFVSWFWGGDSEFPRLLAALAPTSALFAFSALLFALTTEPLADWRLLRLPLLFAYPAYLWLIGLALKKRRSWARPLILLPFAVVAIQQIALVGGRFTILANLTTFALVAIYLYGEVTVRKYFAAAATESATTPLPSTPVG